tara:strand:- start:180 stop:377 length:198 start_codon:yes stop_codon:yes gene_type:complete
MKNKVKLLVVAAVSFFGFGCASTVTVGPKANDNGYLGASASTEGASVTVPFVKAEVNATGSSKKK